MYNKVLIVDDHDSVNEGISKLLNDLKITEINRSQYCDDALLKIKKGVLDKKPYDLVITDLSFKKDYRDSEIKTGEELIKILRNKYPSMRIIVYSMDDRLQKVRNLVVNQNINAYICKGRKGLKELEKAIEVTYKGGQFMSMQVESALNDKLDLEITDYDINLIKHLSKGFSQDEISNQLKKDNISPSSLSSIEKNINKLKTQFEAGNTTHLVSIIKDMGLI